MPLLKPVISGKNLFSVAAVGDVLDVWGVHVRIFTAYDIRAVIDSSLSDSLALCVWFIAAFILQFT